MEQRQCGVERSNRARCAVPGGPLTLEGGVACLLGQYSASAGFGDEHLAMPISVRVPRSDHSAEHDLHVKQVL